MTQSIRRLNNQNFGSGYFSILRDNEKSKYMSTHHIPCFQFLRNPDNHWLVLVTIRPVAQLSHIWRIAVWEWERHWNWSGIRNVIKKFSVSKRPLNMFFGYFCTWEYLLNMLEIDPITLKISDHPEFGSGRAHKFTPESKNHQIFWTPLAPFWHWHPAVSTSVNFWCRVIKLTCWTSVWEPKDA